MGRSHQRAGRGPEDPRGGQVHAGYWQETLIMWVSPKGDSSVLRTRQPASARASDPGGGKGKAAVSFMTLPQKSPSPLMQYAIGDAGPPPSVREGTPTA